LYVGRQNIYYFNGSIDELRISKGKARWTSDFTPPAAEYNAAGDNNAVLLCHFNNTGAPDTGSINIPGRGVDYPAIQGIAPVGIPITVENTDRGLKLTYNTQEGGYVGAGFAYNVQGSDSVDLSGYNSLIFGIKGDERYIKFEVKDIDGKSASVHLSSIDPANEKVWVIPTSGLHEIDLTKVQYMYFIIEGNNKSGTLYVNRVKSSQWIPPTPVVPPPTPNLPPADDTGGIATPPATAEATPIMKNNVPVGFSLNYNTGSIGWAGASFSYDQAKNFSAFDKLAFRMSGSYSKVKFEIMDKFNRKFSLYLTGINSDEQTWIIETSLIQGIDMSYVKSFNFIVEGSNQSGTLQVTGS